MFLVLPGIDINDQFKSFGSFLFISSACLCVPFWDITHVNFSSDSKTSQNTELNEECRIGTASFEEWLNLFLERIFRLVENLPQEHGTNVKNVTMEQSLLNLALNCTKLLFMQLSPSLLIFAIAKVKKFLLNSVLPNGIKFIGSLCNNLKGRNSEFVINSLFQICAEKIFYELEQGASMTYSSQVISKTATSTTYPFGFSSMSDANLHWFQCVLFNILSNSDSVGSMKPEMKKTLFKLIKESIEKCNSWRGYKWAVF